MEGFTDSNDAWEKRGRVRATRSILNELRKLNEVQKDEV